MEGPVKGDEPSRPCSPLPPAQTEPWRGHAIIAWICRTRCAPFPACEHTPTWTRVLPSSASAPVAGLSTASSPPSFRLLPGAMRRGELERQTSRSRIVDGRPFKDEKTRTRAADRPGTRPPPRTRRRWGVSSHPAPTSVDTPHNPLHPPPPPLPDHMHLPSAEALFITCVMKDTELEKL